MPRNLWSALSHRVVVSLELAMSLAAASSGPSLASAETICSRDDRALGFSLSYPACYRWQGGQVDYSTRIVFGELDGDLGDEIVLGEGAEGYLPLDVGAYFWSDIWGFDPMDVPPVPDWPRGYVRLGGPEIGDLDGDGVADIVILAVRSIEPAGGLSQYLNTIEVAFGTGGGRFEEWRVLATLGVSDTIWPELTLGDVDGDTRPDVLVAAPTSDPLTMTVYYSRGRDMLRGGGAAVPTGATDHDKLARDLDGDGRADLLYTRRVSTADDDHRARLYARAAPSTVGAPFGPEREIKGWGEPLWIRRIEVLDLDEDGTVDLFLQIYRAGLDRPNVTLKGNGGGAFTAVWRGPANGGAEGLYALGDVDRDGRIDLIGQAKADPSASGIFVRRGQGSGTFGSAEGPFEGAFLLWGTLGDLDGDGRADAVGWSAPPYQGPVCVAWPQGTTPAADSRLPSVSLLLYPEIINLAGPAMQPDRMWRVSAFSDDDCLRTRVTSRRLDLPAGACAASPAFERATQSGVLLFERPSSGSRFVLLQGPGETAARAAFGAACADGGYRLPNAHPVSLMHDSAYGPDPRSLGSAGGVPPDARLLLRLELAAGKPKRANWTGPGSGVTFTVTAVDEAGTPASASESFPELKRRYCESAEAEQVLCR